MSKVQYKTPDGFPCESADIYSQDSDYPSFTIHAKSDEAKIEGPDNEGWYDIHTPASSVTPLHVSSLARLYLKVDIELTNY